MSQAASTLPGQVATLPELTGTCDQMLSGNCSMRPFVLLCNRKTNLVTQYLTQQESTASGNQETSSNVSKSISSKHTTTDGAQRKCSTRQKREKQVTAAENRWRALLSQLENCPNVPKDHVVYVRRNLAVALRHQRKYKEAESHQRQVRQDLIDIYGENHPKTLASTSNLAVVLCDQHKYTTAETLLQTALLGCKNTLGAQHAATLACQHNLALLYLGQSDGDKAVVTMEHSLAGKRALYARGYPPPLLASMLAMAWILQHLSRQVEATALYEETLEGSLQTLGPEHRVTQACRAILESLGGSTSDRRSITAERRGSEVTNVL